MNLEALPTSKFTKKEFKIADPGVYYAKVSKTEMKTSQAGNEYLSVTFDITDKDGNKKGKLFDMFFESDKSFLQYKLRRFVTACGIPCHGEMTLKDLALLANDSDLVVWVQHDEWNGKSRLAANLRDAEGYYPANSFMETYNIWATIEGKPLLSETEGFETVSEDDEEEIPFATSDDEF